MLRKLFPLFLYLHIFQLEGYSIPRFLTWFSKNTFVRAINKKKGFIWTTKSKILFGLSLLFASCMFLTLIFNFSFLFLAIYFVLVTYPFVFLFLAALVLTPVEFATRQKIKRLTKAKIINLKQQGLVVIGITGSYGKTTTKEYLYELLKTKYKVLKTPESYNTLFGIAKVVDLELTEKFDYFICEMGAYKKGEIKELCNMLMPDHGILTGIGKQHLERFGSLENIISAKFELISAIPDTGFSVLNFGNKQIAEHYARYTKSPVLYGQIAQNNNFSIVNYSNGLITVDFLLYGEKLTVSNLLISGVGNIENLLGALCLAIKLGLSHQEILAGLAHLKPVKHRLEVKDYVDKTIIDDAYSSNIDGFKQALNLLASYPDRPRVLVTPGIIELGDDTQSEHQALSPLINSNCDYVIFVGRNLRTASLAEKVAVEKVTYIESISELAKVLEKLKLTRPVVLIENDLPENY